MKLAWTLLVLVIATSRAAGEPKKPDAATREKAIAHFRQGDEYFKKSQWDNAITEYQAAYDLTGEPLMLFDIALAHDKANHTERAYDAYVRYLETTSLGDGADEARAAKARLQPEIDRIRKERADKQRTDAAARAEAERQQRERLAVQRAQAEQRAAGDDRRAKLLTFGAIALFGAGATSIAFGAKYGFEARTIADEFTHHMGPWTEPQLARDADGHSANTKMIVFTAVGGAVVVSSVVVYLLARRAHSRAERIRVEATSGGAAVSFAGAF